MRRSTFSFISVDAHMINDLLYSMWMKLMCHALKFYHTSEWNVWVCAFLMFLIRSCVRVCGWAVRPGSVCPAWDKENGQSFSASMKYCTCVCVCCMHVCPKGWRDFLLFCLFVSFRCHTRFSFHWISLYLCIVLLIFIPIKKVLLGQQQPKISQLKI